MIDRAAGFDVGVLEGKRVRLEPLELGHAGDLAHAAAEDRSTFGYTAVPDGLDQARAAITGFLQARGRDETIPFAQVRVDTGQAVGVTRYLSLRHWPGDRSPFAVEVGGTWLARSAQRTGLNIEAKLLLFRQAFGVFGVERVDLKTDARNERSRTAILALGATFEGVLRAWQPSYLPDEEGRPRDTAMFSVVRAEWPAVEERLLERLDRR